MKIKRNPIAKAVHNALITGFVASTAFTTVAFAQSNDEDVEEQNRITVTGTRISRVDLEGASPVEVFTAEDIAATGKNTIADFLREASFNNFGSFNQRSGSSAQSQASLSLLGAGSDRTLILLDGKRIPGSPTFGGTSINLNVIPSAAVERVEVLRDGASAIYGSDAVAGVVNIITKKDYNGLHLQTGLSRADAEGADENYHSIVLGSSSDKGSVTVAFDHYRQDPIFDVDRAYTAARAADLDGDGVIVRGIETDGISNYGATIVNPDTGLFEPSPICDQLAASVPGFVGSSINGIPLVEGNGGSRGQVCGYAYANVSANYAGSKRDSVFVSGDYQISDNVEFYARYANTSNESFGRYAPPAAPWLGNVPVGNENNPYNEPVAGRFRWYQLGNRDGNAQDVMNDYLAGVKGVVGNNVEWEFFAHRNVQDNKNVGNTYLSFSGLFTNILQGIDLGSEEGLSNMRATVLQYDRNEFNQYFGGVQFDFGEIAGLPIRHYFGGERQEIQYFSTVDAQSEAGLVGGSSGNSSGASRDVTSFFYEGAAALGETVDVNVALRYDDYSDFGNETSPKISLSWRPMDSLLVRASYGQGFRAPTLAELTQADSFSASFSTDYVACRADGTPFAQCPNGQNDDIRQSNPNLGAEESEFLNVGAVWNVTENFSVGLDFYRIEIDNQITFVSAQDLVFNELAGTLDSLIADYPSLSLERAPNGAINQTRTQTINGGGFTQDGLNLNFSYNWNTDFGLFNFGWDTSYILEREEEAYFRGPRQDTIGFAGLPQLRSNLKASWSMGDHTVSWNLDHIDSTAASEDLIVGSDASVTLIPEGKLSSLTINNLQYKYFGGNWGTYSLGVRNLFDKGPVLDVNGQYTNASLYTVGHIGRVFYAEVDFDF